MTELEKIFIHNIELQEIHFLEFCKISKIVSYNKKEFLLKEGNICSFIGFVESGIIRSFLKNDEKDFNNDFYFPNSFATAYRSFLTQTPAFSSLQALTDTTIRYITFTQIQELQKNSDSWLKFGKHIAENFFINKCKRETSLLKNSAKERYDILLKTHPEIEQFIPQYQIASYLKIEPESLSRIKALTYINKK